MENKRIPMSEVFVQPGKGKRYLTKEEVVDYISDLRPSDPLPPIPVDWDGRRYVLEGGMEGDGFKTCVAAVIRRMPEIGALVLGQIPVGYATRVVDVPVIYDDLGYELPLGRLGEAAEPEELEEPGDL
jgi:hypothetical protein